MRLDEITTRDYLPKFFKEQGYKIGAEVGVYQGDFAEKLCKEGLTLYAIDPWITYKNYRKDPREINYETMYQNVVKLLKPYDCEIIRKTSVEVLNDIPDESLDFVYIDGNHSLPYIAQDVYEWYRKVKKGGILSGHDYFNDKHNPYWIRACHVKYAVDAFADILKTKVQIIGKEDNHPSWIIQKV